MNPIILHNNLLLTASLSASGTYSGYDVQSVLDQRTSSFWRAAAAGSANYIQGAWGGAQAIDAVGICGHNLFSVGATIYVEHSTNGSDWTQATTLIPTTNDTIILAFTSATKQYWRLKISNSSGLPQIAVLYFGVAVQFEYPPNTPIALIDEGINSESSLSETGIHLGTVTRFNDKILDRTFSDFTKTTFYTSTFKPFWDTYGKALNWFFYADDAVNAPSECYFCRFKDGFRLRPEQNNKNYISSLTLNMICA